MATQGDMELSALHGTNLRTILSEMFQEGIVEDPTERLARSLNRVFLQREIGDGSCEIDIFERGQRISGQNSGVIQCRGGGFQAIRDRAHFSLSCRYLTKGMI